MPQQAEPLLGEDLVLLLLAAPTTVSDATARINGITRLEKLLFLADQEEHIQEGVAEPLEFIAYHYGPYSKRVYEAVELLETAGLLTEEPVVQEDSTFDEAEEVETDVTEQDSVERRFRLTPQGEAVGRLLLERHPAVAKSLARVKDEYAGMPLRQLVRYVYAKYEPYTVRSRIRDKIL